MTEEITVKLYSKETSISSSTLAIWKAKKIREYKGIKSKRNLSS